MKEGRTQLGLGLDKTGETQTQLTSRVRKTEKLAASHQRKSYFLNDIIIWLILKRLLLKAFLKEFAKSIQLKMTCFVANKVRVISCDASLLYR